MGLTRTFPRELSVTICVTICVTNLEFSSLYYQTMSQGHQASFICPDQKEKRVLPTKFTGLERLHILSDIGLEVSLSGILFSHLLKSSWYVHNRIVQRISRTNFF